MKPLVIAEAGNNHDGDIKIALKLVLAAGESGVDIVKFQAGIAEGFTCEKTKYVEYQKKELSKNEYDLLVHTASELGLSIMFSVWPINSWRWEEYRKLKYFKIASRQCSYSNIQDYCSETTFISIPQNYDTYKIRQLSINDRFGKTIIPMHCVQEYPASDPMLHRLEYLREVTGIKSVGYSDHTVGIDACKMALDMGACAIEKHFTLNKNQSCFRDHKLSATPDEMKQLVKYSKEKQR